MKGLFVLQRQLSVSSRATSSYLSTTTSRLLSIRLSPLSTILSSQVKPSSHKPPYSLPVELRRTFNKMTITTWTYPQVRRDESFKETLHGTEVADPYRWLEDPESQETKAFVEAENKVTTEYLSQCKEQDLYKSVITKLYDYEKLGTPFKYGDHYYVFHNSGLQAQSVLYQQKTLDDERVLFFDPNLLEKDGTAALQTYSFSDSGKLFGYGISRSGSDWVTLHAGEDLVDEIQWAKFTGIVWSQDEQGFFYSRYPEPNVSKDKAGTETGSNQNCMIYYHRLGTPQSEDQLIAKESEFPDHMLFASTSKDGRWLMITVSENCNPVNKLWFIRLEEGGRVPETITINKLIDNFDASYNYIANDGDRFYLMTNANSPRSKVVMYDVSAPEKGFIDIIPQHEKNVLEEVGAIANDYLYVHYMEDVKSVISIHRLETGEKVRDIPMPIGSVKEISGRRKDQELFFKFASFLNPGVIYRYDFASDAISTYYTTEVNGFDGSEFETQQVFVKSKDGVEFPIFITARKGITLDHSHPALLYGYGGFAVAIPPSFSPSWVLFLQHFHGILVVANIRGGNEYGEAWHEDGKVHKKQNVFDDFQSAAKYLCDQGYTQSKLITIKGAPTAPELFGCGLAAVGVMDVLRFHKFTIGHAWRSDYGNPDKKEDFEYILRYSPLHNVQSNKTYPALLLTTSDHDDRVVPLHSYKLIAELQHKLPNNPHPLMIHVETKAGHGAGKPTAKKIDEWSNEFAFMALSLGLKWYA
ncbi:prolyl oligopeptidase [Syncephalis plumigaleata]|nr:prolyl oligopeptidase [Syncephalis plumigaleata]